MDPFERIFETFKTVSSEEWKEKLISDLKGKDFQELIWKDPNNIEHLPFYQGTAENDYPNIVQKEQLGWKIVQSYHLQDWESVADLKKEIEQAMESGLQIALVEDQSLATEMLDELSEIGNVYFYSTEEVAENIPSQMFDPISNSIRKGSNDQLNIDLLKDNFGSFSDENSFLLVDGSLYAERAANAVQELSMILAHLTDYFDQLTDADYSAEEIADSLIIRCSIGSSYFTEMAKIRALRWNVKKVFAHYGIKKEPMIWAESNPFFLDSESFNTNLIRLSAGAMSAVIGGSDWVGLSTQASSKKNKSFASRMCRNIQLILKHESHLDKVDDLVRGAYYIEELTNELAELSWERFLNLEADGGLLNNAFEDEFWAEIDQSRSDLVQDYIEAKSVMIGVNKYQFNEGGESERLRTKNEILSDQLKNS